jgi:hypothetical protein
MRIQNGFRSPLLIFAIVTIVTAQTGGTYDLSHTVIATGGGSNSSGGIHIVDGTSGQPVAGTVSTGGSFGLRGGFWAFETLAPTAAPVRISGRVVLSGAVPSGRVHIRLIRLSDGFVREVSPNQFGYYHFDDIEIGAYLMQATSANCRFTPNQIFLDLLDDLIDANFSQISP